MIAWSLLVGVLLVAVLHRLDLAVEPAARSKNDASSARLSAGDGAAPGLPDPAQLPVPPASGLAASTRSHRFTSVTVGKVVAVARQLTLRLLPHRRRLTPARRP